MRKTWVKRDNIYYKPFYKQKLKMTLLGVLLMAFVFFGYQFFYIRNNGAGGKQPSNNNAVQDEGGGGGDGNRTADFRGPSEDARYVYVEKVGSYEKRILRGIRLRDLDAYQPGSSAAFRCLSSTRHVSWARVNDDYCDCPEDGSDEPGTGACDRGRFYCRFQKRHATGRGGYTSVPSGWANDGVCDCCDGSDEWLSGADCRNTCKERFPY
uniref:Glucosidase 2 subunit beta n=1 Tax=Culex pipiens TaxID=7175 RepID=A0A8D8HNS4_CULPI